MVILKALYSVPGMSSMCGHCCYCGEQRRGACHEISSLGLAPQSVVQGHLCGRRCQVDCQPLRGNNESESREVASGMDVCKPYLLSLRVGSDAYWILTPDCCGSPPHQLPRTGKKNISEPSELTSYLRGVSLGWGFSALLSRKPSTPPPPLFSNWAFCLSLFLCAFFSISF